MLEKFTTLLPYLFRNQKPWRLNGVVGKRVLHIIFFSLVLLLDNNTLLAEERRTFRVAFFTESEAAIYWDEKNKRVEGPLVALYQSISSELDVDIQFLGPVPFKRFVTGISNGAYDMGALMSKDPEREKLMYFSATPLAYGKDHLVVAKRLQLGKHSSIKSLQDFGPLLKSIGKERLIFPIGIVMPDFIKLNADKINLWKLTLNPEDWRDQASRLIEAGRAGAVLILNTKVAISIASKSELLEAIELPNTRSLYIVFSKKTTGQDFADKFNNKFSDLSSRYDLHQATWKKRKIKKEQFPQE